ncbi:amidohydrolase family protein [Leifsonia sp. NPDC077715]|uniref:amidohydrolase family protein n=1 Tax=Leifsonia sp. NPDC077715 TaxID=3155539 RepID=UPI00342BB9F0
MRRDRVILDAHQHLWELSRTPQPWIDPVTMPELARDFGPEQHRELLLSAAIDSAILVQTVNTKEETAWLLDVAAWAGAAGVVGWIDLAGTDIGRQIADLRAGPGGAKLVGVRHLTHLEPDAGWLERDDVRRGIAAVGRAGLALELVVNAQQLPSIPDLVQALPDVQFVLDHLGYPPVDAAVLKAWERILVSIAAAENAAAKFSGLRLSALQRSTQEVHGRRIRDAALSSFGPARLMWGSDWPLVLRDGSYAQWLAIATELMCDLSPHESERFWAGTAVDVYRLSDR